MATAKASESTPVKRNPLKVEIVPGKPIIRMKRTFDFPRELVWRLFTSGEHMSKWWGPARYQTIVHEYDARPGGKWHMDNTEPGMTHSFRGEFLEVKAPEKLVWTFGYADYPPSTETVLFIADGNKTHIEIESVFVSMEARDGMASSNMEAGASETYERLDAVLAQLSATRT